MSTINVKRLIPMEYSRMYVPAKYFLKPNKPNEYGRLWDITEYKKDKYNQVDNLKYTGEVHEDEAKEMIDNWEPNLVLDVQFLLRMYKEYNLLPTVSGEEHPFHMRNFHVMFKVLNQDELSEEIITKIIEPDFSKVEFKGKFYLKKTFLSKRALDKFSGILDEL